MKLIEFNPETLPSEKSAGQKTLPFMSIGFRSGLFSIGKPTVELMKLKPGDQVQIVQDEDEADNWYIEKVKSGGYTLRSKGDAPTLYFNSAPLAKVIAEFMDIDGTSCRIPVAGQPTDFEKRKFYGLLLIGAKVKAKKAK